MDFSNVSPYILFEEQARHLQALMPSTGIMELVDSFNKTFKNWDASIKGLSSWSRSINSAVGVSSFSNAINSAVGASSFSSTINSLNLCDNIFSEYMGTIWTTLPEQNDDFNDYVSLAESTAKVFEIPDYIAIPLGNSRVKINTGNFIAIIGIIISMFLTIAIAMAQSEPSETDLERNSLIELQNQLLQSQNETLSKLLESVDTAHSNPAQAEALQSLKENVESQNSAISDLQESLDSIQQSIDNMQSSENTASED